MTDFYDAKRFIVHVQMGELHDILALSVETALPMHSVGGGQDKSLVGWITVALPKDRAPDANLWNKPCPTVLTVFDRENSQTTRSTFADTVIVDVRTEVKEGLAPGSCLVRLEFHDDPIVTQ